MGLRCRALVLLAAAGLVLRVAAAATAQECVGDCSADATVTIEELVRGVSLTLDPARLAECPAFDPIDDDHVTIDELLRAIDNALTGCTLGSLTPTPIPSESPAATATQSPEPTTTPSSQSTPTEAAEPTPTQSSEPTVDVPLGFRPDVRIQSSDVDRSYALFVPLDYDPGRAYPVVFVFHGDGGTGADVRNDFGLEPWADGAAIFVYPNATDESGRSFDLEAPLVANADMRLFLDILAALESTYSINRGRVFAAGMSRGAFFANFLNCRFGDGYLRAIAAHSGSGPYGPASEYDEEGHFRCEAPAAAAVMIHGTDDAVVPLNDALYSRFQWTWANQCADQTVPEGPDPCERYEACAAGKPVMWCAVPGLRHEIWNRAPEAIWGFFASLL